MAKGQEDLKTLLLKDKKKKPKKSVGVLKFGRRLRGPAKGALVLLTPSNMEDIHEEDNNLEIDEAEADYSEEQSPPTIDKYKKLEDCLSAMEIQQIPGLDLGDMGLVSGVVIPQKFKIPTFVLYDGVSCPKMHLKSYVRKIQPYTTDPKLWIHFFQENLVGTLLEHSLILQPSVRVLMITKYKIKLIMRSIYDIDAT